MKQSIEINFHNLTLNSDTHDQNDGNDVCRTQTLTHLPWCSIPGNWNERKKPEDCWYSRYSEIKRVALVGLMLFLVLFNKISECHLGFNPEPYKNLLDDVDNKKAG